MPGSIYPLCGLLLSNLLVSLLGCVTCMLTGGGGLWNYCAFLNWVSLMNHKRLEASCTPSVILSCSFLSLSLSSSLPHPLLPFFFLFPLSINPSLLFFPSFSLSHPLLPFSPPSRAQFPSESVHVLTDHSDEVWFLAFSHDGTRLASGAKDGQIIIWNITVSV